MNFPKNESGVFELAINVSSGLTGHAADFPHVDPAALGTAIAAYTASRNTAEDTRSQARIATAAKRTALDGLEFALKTALKQAEVDCAVDPEKLSEIGWGPKAPPTPLTPPHQVTDFRCTEQGQGTVSLEWKRAVEGSRPSCFVLQRRQFDSAAEAFGAWAMVAFYYDNRITATDQPRGIALEYRVIASNPAGSSLPSNAAAVVL